VGVQEYIVRLAGVRRESWLLWVGRLSERAREQLESGEDHDAWTMDSGKRVQRRDEPGDMPRERARRSSQVTRIHLHGRDTVCEREHKAIR
jgi:hypothetical protein